MAAASSLARAPLDLVSRVRRDVERNALRARNGIKMATGYGRPGVGCTPKDVVWSSGKVELWHYRSESVGYRPPVLIAFSLVTRSYILDLAPGNSFVQRLLDAGLDVYLVDWGVPDEHEAHNRLEDYTDRYLPQAIEQVLEDSGCDEVNLLGYCFGGVLSLLCLAHQPDLPVRSLTTIATPVDMTKMGLFAELFRRGELKVDDVLDENGNLPPSVMRQGFRILKPTADLAKYATLLEKLWDDRYVDSYQTMTQWTSDHIPFPGAAARQSVEMLMRENGMMTDQLRLGGERVHLSDIRCPLLNVVAERDHIVPVEAAKPLLDLVGSSEKDELLLDAGHIGLAVGGTAAKVTIPRIIEFLQRRSDKIPAAGAAAGGGAA